MKLSIQNHDLMVTLPQAKAKSRALRRYLTAFGFIESLDDADAAQTIEGMSNALRTGGTMYSIDFFFAVAILFKSIPDSHKALHENFETMKGSPQWFTETESFKELDKACFEAQEVHNAVVDLLVWLQSRGLRKATLASVLAEGMMDDEPLSVVLSRLRNSAIEANIDIDWPHAAEYEHSSQYAKYAVALKLLRDLGQPQLADDFLRTEGVMA
jgi:hypothetical protein